MRLRSDEGLWVVPSRGIHTVGLMFPIDVIYLDTQLRVIHVIESLGPLRFGPLSLRCKSVLELPARSIYDSGTHLGDQLMICGPNEMEAYWAAQEPVVPPRTLRIAIEISSKKVMRWPGWWKKAKERRKSRRIAVDCLEAVYWDGSVSSSHAIREISYHGAVIVTLVNWCVGTLIRINVRRSGESVPAPGSEQLHSDIWCRVVRRCADGFCVEFLYFDPVERENFRRFLESKEVKVGLCG